MKKLILIPLVLIIHCPSFAQQQIEGLGVYKLGNPMSGMLRPSTIENAFRNVDKEGLVVTFQIRNDQIMPDFPLHLDLYFFNDTLYKIHLEYTPDVFVETFKSKFGPGTYHISKKRNNKKVILETYETTNWKTQSNAAELTVYSKYDTKHNIPDEVDPQFVIMDVPRDQAAERQIRKSEKDADTKAAKALYEKL